MRHTNSGTERAGRGTRRGEDIPIASRITQIGEFTEVAHRVGGTAAAVSVAEKHAGSQFDPELASAFCAHAEEILDGLDGGETWDAVIGAEPSLGVYLSPSQFDAALLAIADFVDLKSPYTLGHARGVSELAAAAAATVGLGDTEVRAAPPGRRRARAGPTRRVQRHLGQTRNPRYW